MTNIVSYILGFEDFLLDIMTSHYFFQFRPTVLKIWVVGESGVMPDRGCSYQGNGGDFSLPL